MIRKQSILIILLTSLVITTSGAVSGILRPKIAPGYAPEETETEQGLWMELGDYERAIQRSALLIKDASINEYVQSVACRVAGDYCPDIRVYVLRNPNFNASMTANGVIQIWTGLLVRVNTEDELAAVLGHELAHYTQLHTLERLQRLKKNTATASVFDLGLILLTGSSIPLGQMAAIANLMAYNRVQEEEADQLGIEFMTSANYDPYAAPRVWEMVVEEDQKAAFKRLKPGLFSKTHPGSEARISHLTAFVNQNYPHLIPQATSSNRHVQMLDENYMMLMEDQIDTNRFGRTEAILDQHQKIGIRPGLIEFFRGEMFRQRDREGDTQRAMQAYQRAVEGEEPVAEAYHNLAYIQLKRKNMEAASVLFRRYLELKPDADDRAMIEFYLQEEYK